MGRHETFLNQKGQGVEFVLRVTITTGDFFKLIGENRGGGILRDLGEGSFNFRHPDLREARAENEEAQ